MRILVPHLYLVAGELLAYSTYNIRNLYTLQDFNVGRPPLRDLRLGQMFNLLIIKYQCTLPTAFDPHDWHFTARYILQISNNT